MALLLMKIPNLIEGIVVKRPSKIIVSLCCRYSNKRL